LFDDVQAFIDKTLALRTVVSAPSDSRLAAKAAAVADVEAEQPFVRILWNTAHAQGAFALSLGAAKSLAHTLAVAVKTGGDRKRQIGDVA
jgi:hypothetical protein